MEQAEQERVVELPADVTQSEELEENLEVTIKEPFLLGLCFGMGFGAAMLVYVLLGLVVVKMLLEALTDFRSW